MGNHKNEKNETNKNKSLLEMFDVESKPNSETGEKPSNSSTIADEVNLKDDVTGKKPNDKKSVRSAGDEAGDDKKVRPELCDCDLTLFHTVNLHKFSTLE